MKIRSLTEYKRVQLQVHAMMDAPDCDEDELEELADALVDYEERTWPPYPLRARDEEE